MGFIDINFYHRVNYRYKYADRFYNFMIDDNHGYIPSRLIMSLCTVLRHALQHYHRKKGVPPKASKSTLKANGSEHSNYLNYQKEDGNTASCCTATHRKVWTSPNISDAYTFLMNSWNALHESNQQSVHGNILAVHEGQIHQVENPTPARIICTIR